MWKRYPSYYSDCITTFVSSNNGVHSPPITELDMVLTRLAYCQIGQRLDANKHQEDVSNHREENSVN